MLIQKIISFFSKRKKNKREISNPEMSNVINSMFLCRPIYDKLKVKCHPDKFVDEKMKAQAEILFQELQVCKYNHKRLLEIEVEINSISEFESNK